MANNLKKADFGDLDPILKGEDEFFKTWCQYKKCRHWSKLAFYAFSAKSNEKTLENGQKPLKWPITSKKPILGIWTPF